MRDSSARWFVWSACLALLLIGARSVAAQPPTAVSGGPSSTLTLAAGGGARTTTLAGRTTYRRGSTLGVSSALGPIGSGLPVGLRNGDFSDGLADWMVAESGGGVTPGSVSVIGDAAVLLEGDSFLVTLQQEFILPAFSSELSFFIELDPGFDTTAGFIPDAFEASLLDANQVPVVEPWTLGATSAFNLQEDLTAEMGTGVTWDGVTGRVTIDVTEVPSGLPVTLYFDLVGADADLLSGVTIDDVTLVVDPPVASFLRGDHDASGVVDSADEIALFDRIVSGFGEALDCTGTPIAGSVDIFDANDNEVLTIADYLRVRNRVVTGDPLPAPALFCAFDSSDDLAGFDSVDTDYSVAPGEITVEPISGVVDRDVFLPVLIDAPVDVAGVTVILDFDASLLTPFDPVAGDGEPFVSSLGDVFSRVEGGRIVATVFAASDGSSVIPGAPGVLQEVGVLRFHLADFATVPPVDWQAEAALGGDTVRATVVDTTFADHQPELFAGSGLFVRGDVNDDALIDISDTVFTLNYLFVFGPEPSCLDAADLNNDGTVDVSDTVYLLNFLFIFGRPIPSPSPACGFDVGTIDSLDCAESVCQ